MELSNDVMPSVSEPVTQPLLPHPPAVVQNDKEPLLVSDNEADHARSAQADASDRQGLSKSRRPKRPARLSRSLRSRMSSASYSDGVTPNVGSNENVHQQNEPLVQPKHGRAGSGGSTISSASATGSATPKLPPLSAAERVVNISCAEDGAAAQQSAESRRPHRDKGRASDKDKRTRMARSKSVSDPTNVTEEASLGSRRDSDVSNQVKGRSCGCSSSNCPHPIHRTRSKPKPVPIDVQAQREKVKQTQAIKEAVALAAQKKKVFVMSRGYNFIREALLQRGWVEKAMPLEETVQRGHATAGLRVLKDEPQYKTVADCDDEDMAATLRFTTDFDAAFIWARKKSHISYPTLQSWQLANHYKGNNCLTTKGGLARTLQKSVWTEGGPCDAYFPRCFYIESSADLMDFVDYYRAVTLRSLLRCAVGRGSLNKSASLPGAVVDLCYKAAAALIDPSNDSSLESETSTTEESHNSESPQFAGLTDLDWEVLIQMHYRLMGCDKVDTPARMHAYVEGEDTDTDDDDDQDVPESDNTTENDTPKTAAATPKASKQKEAQARKQTSRELLEELQPIIQAMISQERTQRATELLDADATTSSVPTGELESLLMQLEESNDQSTVEGDTNLWVVKPAALSRGRGIFCDNRIHDILPVFMEMDAGGLCTRWVVQKYIERPLLVHDIKFDIRQWVVVTDWNPLTIWLYRDSYLRFSTAPFKLEDIRNPTSRDVHLCNNSVQKHAKGFDGLQFAPGCMWKSSQLADYLDSEGHNGAWENQVYPAIRRVTTAAMMAAQQQMDFQRNCFEMFGLDFVVDANLNVWLLEINSSPDMSLSTAITSEMVPRVSEDLIKVVVDARRRKKADTGNFELIHRGPEVEKPLAANGRALSLQGTAITRKRAPNKDRLNALSRPVLSLVATSPPSVKSNAAPKSHVSPRRQRSSPRAARVPAAKAVETSALHDKGDRKRAESSGARRAPDWERLETLSKPSQPKTRSASAGTERQPSAPVRRAPDQTRLEALAKPVVAKTSTPSAALAGDSMLSVHPKRAPNQKRIESLAQPVVEQRTEKKHPKKPRRALPDRPERQVVAQTRINLASQVMEAGLP